jgi:DNA processing protein
MDERSTLIWLNSIGIPSDKIARFIEYYGNAAEIHAIDGDELKSFGVFSEAQISSILDKKTINNLTDYMKKVRIKGAEIITSLDENYPRSLYEIEDRPIVLYVKGTLESKDMLSIGIVGSRKATSYGKWVCEKFSGELVQLGVTIVSGLALGIDTCAHKAALEIGGRTIAVLGSGIDIVYPPKNSGLYTDITNSGAIISEFPLGTPPLPYHFPMRNRIISGLTRGTVVIEAQEKSGSLITAHLAANQGKPVFAVPGNINSIYSKGTNLLIRDGARPLLEINDIIEEIAEFRMLAVGNKISRLDEIELSETESKIVDLLKDGPMHCDILALRSGFDVSTVISTLTILEMKEVIMELSSRTYVIR